MRVDKRGWGANTHSGNENCADVVVLIENHFSRKRPPVMVPTGSDASSRGV